MTTAYKLLALLKEAHKHDAYGLLEGCEIGVRKLPGLDETEVYIIQETDRYPARELDWRTILYNHDIARALFPGITMVQNYQHFEKADFPRYLYHLQQAVISDSPIDYLYNIIFGEKNATNSPSN